MFVEIGEHRSHYFPLRIQRFKQIFVSLMLVPSPDIVLFRIVSVFTCPLFDWFVCAGPSIVNTASYDIDEIQRVSLWV